MAEIADFDKTVGTIAGAIYSDISRQFPHPPLMLVPAITFKVRKVLEPKTDLRLLSDGKKAELAREIQLSMIPMLFSYEIDETVIEKIAPVIESAAFKILLQIDGVIK